MSNVTFNTGPYGMNLASQQIASAGMRVNDGGADTVLMGTEGSKNDPSVPNLTPNLTQSFPPLSRPDARVLVLGSMPGKVSLDAFQYYAHPRNAFWGIMAELFQFERDQSYALLVQSLLAQKVAVWDVAKQCIRPGSLDSNIVDSSVVANDFNGFFSSHPDVQLVCLNGGKAAALYKKHVLSKLESAMQIDWEVLPSTSPANAGLHYEQKVQMWAKALK
jgi:hypoxanthine-DNA glycosylase